MTSALAESVDRIGPVTSIVSPNKLHHLFLAEWQQRYPDARLYAPPDLERRKPDLRFHAQLTDSPEISWSGEIDQLVFRGSFAMAEVVFYHRLSRTAVFGDLIQRFPAETTRGWKGILMRLSGLVGPHGTTPIDWRLSFISRSGARAARRKCLDWNPERLVIAHGLCTSSGATEVIEAALSWI